MGIFIRITGYEKLEVAPLFEFFTGHSLVLLYFLLLHFIPTPAVRILPKKEKASDILNAISAVRKYHWSCH